VQFPADLVHPEQHHAKKARFKEERGQHLVSHQRPDHRPGQIGKDRPVGAELIGHDYARHDAHRKGDGENLDPVFEQVEVNWLARLEPQPFKHREIARQTD